MQYIAINCINLHHKQRYDKEENINRYGPCDG